ncbi:MAG TPA: hypothetical protein PK665_15445 [Ignavibacteriaceae bacterium]|jgi:hypothetical protein|nr:hypothetical protein [Ignavibacteriaceae bacterium]
MAGVDNLIKGSMSGVDNLTLGSGTAADNLLKGSGSAADGLDKQAYTLANEDQTLDDSVPTTLDVLNTDDFPASGFARVIAKLDNTEEIITYTGKTETTLTGVTCELSSYDVKIGDRIETR